MGIYTEAIQKLYVAYFNRPADAFGLQNWEGLLTDKKVSLTDVSKAFAGSDEYKKAYAGMDALHVVAQVYLNLFNNSNPDTAGLLFWASKLQAGVLSIDTIVQNIADGAQGTDKDAYVAKVAAATAFTAQLDTAKEMLGYNGDIANQMAKTWMSTIKDDASLKAAIADAALSATVMSITNPPVPGQTFTLTQGLDTVNGTSGDDVINAFAFNGVSGSDTTTLQSVDTIDGGAGKDTLNIEIKGNPAAAAPGANFNGSIVGTIKNVETINIDATAATAALNAVDASVFAGATLVNQISKAADVSGLAAGTTAGFQGVIADVGAGLDVAAASAATSASISLNGVKGDAATDVAIAGSLQNQAHFNVTGAKLASVTVAGTLAKNATAAGSKAATLALNVTAGKDVQALTVNSAVTTTLTAGNAVGSTKALTSVDASASAGAITYVGGAAVKTIKSGAGADKITVATTTAVDDTSTTDTDETVSAVVSTGAGNDTITVNVTGAGLTSIDAGDGSDTVSVAATAQNVTVNAGAGDDVVTFDRGVGAKDVVNGGDGYDTLSIKGTSLIAQDYEILRAVVTGVEALDFQQGIANVDASKLAQFSEFDIEAASSLNKVADAQSIVAFANVSATNAGYVQGSSASNATYAGTLDVTAFGGSAGAHVVVNAYAKDVVLNVSATPASAAGAGVASMVELTGDAKTATVNLTNSVNAATGSTPTADVLATFVLNTGAGTVAAGGYNAGAYAADKNLTTLTLTGNGQAVVSNAASATVKLTTIDASGMTGVAAYDSTKVVGGLDFTGNDNLAETVKLGGGHDVVRGASNYANMDTISGLKLVGDANGNLVTAKSDLIVTGTTGFAKTTVTGATLGLALTDAAAKAADKLVFQYNGDTYIFIDNAANAIDASNTVGTFGSDDVVIKLVGTVDLDLLVQDLNVGAVPAPVV